MTSTKKIKNAFGKKVDKIHGIHQDESRSDGRALWSSIASISVRIKSLIYNHSAREMGWEPLDITQMIKTLSERRSI